MLSKFIYLLPTPASHKAHLCLSTETPHFPLQRACLGPWCPYHCFHPHPRSAPYSFAGFSLVPPCLCPRAGPPVGAGDWHIQSKEALCPGRGGHTLPGLGLLPGRILCWGQALRGAGGLAGEASGHCGFHVSPRAWSEEPCLLSCQPPETEILASKTSEAKMRLTSETRSHLWTSCVEWDKQGHLLLLGD